MEHHAGLDVSLKETSVCIVDGAGKIIRETKVDSEPEALVGYFASLEIKVVRIGLEAGPLSQWLHAALSVVQRRAERRSDHQTAVPEELHAARTQMRRWRYPKPSHVARVHPSGTHCPPMQTKRDRP